MELENVIEVKIMGQVIGTAIGAADIVDTNELQYYNFKANFEGLRMFPELGYKVHDVFYIHYETGEVRIDFDEDGLKSKLLKNEVTFEKFVEMQDKLEQISKIVNKG